MTANAPAARAERTRGEHAVVGVSACSHRKSEHANTREGVWGANTVEHGANTGRTRSQTGTARARGSGVALIGVIEQSTHEGIEEKAACVLHALGLLGL